MTQSSAWRFRSVWTLLGPVASLALGYLVLRPSPSGGVYWQGAIVYGLIAGSAAYAQAIWARKWRLPLPAGEFAILVGIAAAIGMGLKFGFSAAPAIQGPWLWQGLAVGAQLLLVAAPSSALRQAGVDLRRWWVVNILAIVARLIVTQLAAYWAFLRLRDSGFSSATSASSAKVEMGAGITAAILLAYMVSAPIWAAVQRRWEGARE